MSSRQPCLTRQPALDMGKAVAHTRLVYSVANVVRSSRLVSPSCRRCGQAACGWPRTVSVKRERPFLIFSLPSISVAFGGQSFLVEDFKHQSSRSPGFPADCRYPLHRNSRHSFRCAVARRATVPAHLTLRSIFRIRVLEVGFMGKTHRNQPNQNCTGAPVPAGEPLLPAAACRKEAPWTIQVPVVLAAGLEPATCRL